MNENCGKDLSKMSKYNKKYRGLNDHEVNESRRQNGRNVLTPVERDSNWKLFFERLTGPLGHFIPGWNNGDALIFILEIAAILSVIVAYFESGEKGFSVFFEPIGIIIAVFLATGVSFYFERRANKEFMLLNKVDDEEKVLVIRKGRYTKIAKKDLVVGDIIILTPGDEVPADAEILESTNLNIDESTLTGEPSCRKSAKENDFDPEATFPTNHVLRGTKVLEGHAVCKVFAVGDHTESGKVMEAVQLEDNVKTPLNEQLDRLGKYIAYASYVVAFLVIFGRVAMLIKNLDDGSSWYDFEHIDYHIQSVMLAVAIIVMAVPEGLPMAISISLAYSMQRMLKEKNLVRKMHACETMGATTVICTDKTGTLTENNMQVHETRFYALEGQKLSDDAMSLIVKESIGANSTAHLELLPNGTFQSLGNPTEGALLIWLAQNDADYLQIRSNIEILQEVPFSTEWKYMAIVVRSSNGKRMLYVKGAPEIVLRMCANYTGGMTEDEILQQLHDYQNQAMRTIAFAYQELDETENVISNHTITASRLTFLGIVAIADPVRKDVPAAVKECLDAHIAIKIITGDTACTAKKIAHQIGIWADDENERHIITGPEFETLSDEELLERINDIKIVARARPLDKQRLVEILQKKGHVVAVTGDGTNDAPALKQAHVGISMGDGTSVAKEASDITIIDNSFSSICKAVLWGRSLYRNIQRFLLFQLTINVAACLTVLIGSFIGTDMPLTITQILWINLIMDTFAAMALTSLPPSREVMTEKPRQRNAFIISRPMRESIAVTGFIFAIITLFFTFSFEHIPFYKSWPDLIAKGLSEIKYLFSGALSTRHIEQYEHGLIFTIFVMFQFWNLFNAKAFMTGKSAINMKGCKTFLFIAAIILIGQILIVTFGNGFFEVKPICLWDWGIIILLTLIVVFGGEIFRLYRLFRKKQKNK